MPVGSSLDRVKIDRCEESGPTRGRSSLDGSDTPKVARLNAKTAN